MSVTISGGVIRVEGAGRLEDAETLTGLLQANSGCRVDLTAASGLHTALVQVLLAFRPGLIGPSGDAFVNDRLLPLLQPEPPTGAVAGIETRSERP